MAYNYHHLYGLRCTGLRLFSVYGPWGRPDMALYLFVANIMNGKSINVYNKGNMERDFTYVSDAVDGVLAAIDNPMEYDIINLGRGEPQELMHFISCIENELGAVAKKKMMPMHKGDVKTSHADIAKAQRLLGYEPRVSIEEGVREFIEWYRSYHD
jgi:UDP-glucuronate 4-epimerase